MIIWGGSTDRFFEDGGRYDPRTDTWRPMALEGAPSPRHRHTAVWTGSEMIVWGGQTGFRDDERELDDGARYDPVTDRWASMATDGAPGPRRGHVAVWTGQEMLIWGGTGPRSGHLHDGARYQPRTDTWTPLPPGGQVSGGSGAVNGTWTGSELVVLGGVLDEEIWRGLFAIGARWDAASNAWTPLSTVGAVSNRLNPKHVVWSGSEVLAWYPWSLFDGGPWLMAYDPTSDTWDPRSVEGTLTPRDNTTAVWTDREFVLLGGSLSNRSADRGISVVGGGGAYAPATDTWRLFGAPSGYAFPAVWADGEILAFAGVGNTGGTRYLSPCHPEAGHKAGSIE
jgi:N-acetylneuraminic acid mutarotase